MEASFPGRSAQPAGRFKVGMPQSLARHCILPRIGEFLQQYPDLELILCSSDNVEDIIQEGFDCVIRTGRIEDSTTTVARPLARYRWMVLASPAWLAAHGRPQVSTNCTSIGRWATLITVPGGPSTGFSPSMTATARSACGRRWWSTILMPTFRPAFRAGPDPRRQLSGATFSAERGAGRLSGAGRF